MSVYVGPVEVAPFRPKRACLTGDRFGEVTAFCDKLGLPPAWVGFQWRGNDCRESALLSPENRARAIAAGAIEVNQ